MRKTLSRYLGAREEAGCVLMIRSCSLPGSAVNSIFFLFKNNHWGSVKPVDFIFAVVKVFHRLSEMDVILEQLVQCSSNTGWVANDIRMAWRTWLCPLAWALASEILTQGWSIKYVCLTVSPGRAEEQQSWEIWILHFRNGDTFHLTL